MAIGAWLGWSGLVKVRLGAVGRGKSRRGKSRRGRPGTASQGGAGLVSARQASPGGAGRGTAGFGVARRGEVYMTETTPERLSRRKDGQNLSVPTTIRLTREDRWLLREIGFGNLTRGIERLLEAFREMEAADVL